VRLLATLKYHISNSFLRFLSFIFDQFTWSSIKVYIFIIPHEVQHSFYLQHASTEPQIPHAHRKISKFISKALTTKGSSKALFTLG
jgi:hypothetical protein